MVPRPSLPFPLPRRLYYGWVIVGASLLMNVASTPLNPVIFSFFMGPMAEDMGWSRAALSWALTFRLLASGLTSPFLGAAIDRIGSRWLGVFGGLVAAASLVALAYSHQLWIVYVLFAISGGIGLGGGPGGNLLTTVPVAKWFARRRGRALSIVTIGMAVGTVVGIPIAQALISGLGWRGAWIAFGLFLGLIVVPISALFMRRAPEDLGIKLEEADGDQPGAGADRRRQYNAGDDWTLSQALRAPVLWTVLLALVLSGVALSGTLVYRVGFWNDSGMAPSLVAFGTALDPFTVIFSVLLFGMLAERLSLRLLGLIGGLGLGASMVPMFLPPQGAASILAHNIIWGAAAGAYITFNNLVWPTYFGRKFLGTIRGVVFPVVVAANAFSAPLYGFLLDHILAPTTLWAISSGLFVLAGGLLFLAKKPSLKSVLAPAALKV